MAPPSTSAWNKIRSGFRGEGELLKIFLRGGGLENFEFTYNSVSEIIKNDKNEYELEKKIISYRYASK